MTTDICSFKTFASRLGRISAVSAHELLLVYLTARRVARIHVAATDATRLAEALVQMGLEVVPWRYALLSEDKEIIENYHFRASLIPDSALNIGARVLFVGRDQEYLREVESRAHLPEVHGQDLEYPECCSRHYSANSEIFLTGFNRFYGKRFSVLPFVNNIFLDSFGWTLLSHFPCAPNCHASHQLAARYLKAIMEFDPCYGMQLVQRLRALVVYTPGHGLLCGKVDMVIDEQTYAITDLLWSQGWRRLVDQSESLLLHVGKSLSVTGISVGEDYTVYDCR